MVLLCSYRKTLITAFRIFAPLEPLTLYLRARDIPQKIIVSKKMLYPPPIFYLGNLADPTPGAPPTCPSRFHLTPIHTILDEWLGIFESYY